MSGATLIRPAEPSDADALSALVSELGYPAPSDDIPARLRTLTSERAIALVAERDGAVVGFATAHVISTIHSPGPVGWLTLLVVAERVRGGGVGRALVAQAEAWARSMGAAKLSVTSGAQRDDAHAFYERIGFARTGVRFGKPL
jgi:GNAT superfamily N-acetyltransferase